MSAATHNIGNANCTGIAPFRWTQLKSKAASLLAGGLTWDQVAHECGIARRTLAYWCSNPVFSAEVDRLTLMTDVALRAERLRYAKRVVRQKIENDGSIQSGRDILDWLSLTRREPEGVKLGLLTELESRGEPPVQGTNNH